MSESLTRKALHTLLHELFNGTDGHGWLFNRGDGGLAGSLENLSADAASEAKAGGGTIVQQLRHILYHLELLNKFAKGDPNPFADADWSASWKYPHADRDEWTGLKEELHVSADSWLAAVQSESSWDAVALTGALGSAVHISHHLGTIRQMMREGD